MIDTLMALWNRDRRKRARQLLLIFFLICISISLLLVTTEGPEWSRLHHQSSNTALSPASPTGTSIQNTVGPEATPTSTFIVVNQPTPAPTNGAPSTSRTPVTSETPPTNETPATGGTQPCITNSTDTTGNTIYAPHTSAAIQPEGGTPGAKATSSSLPVTQRPSKPASTVVAKPSKLTPATPNPKPVVGAAPVSPSPTLLVTPVQMAQPGSTPTTNATETSRSTPTVHGAPPYVPALPRDGGPIIIPTPMPTQAGSTSSGDKASGSSGTGSNGSGSSGSDRNSSRSSGAGSGGSGTNGGGSNCTGNDISAMTDADIVAILEHNTVLILGSSLLGTTLFYTAIYIVTRRRRRER